MKTISHLRSVILIAFAVAASLPARAQDMNKLVDKALAFKTMLTTTQQGVLQKTYTPQLGRHWSNLPDFACGPKCRNGVKFANLSAGQLAAAKAVIAAAIGGKPEEGFEEFMEVTLADSVLSTDAQPGDFSNGFYYISFLNPPSADGAWMLQFGGHHIAGNIAFNKGALIGATPYFQGAEPVAFTATGGKPCAPLAQEQAGFKAMLASLDAKELAASKINGNFGDVVLGPGKDAAFPAQKVGLKVGTLSALKQAAVLAAMDAYLNDIDSVPAAALRSIYESELENTYIAYAGNASLSANGHYVRIDGPSVWIELVVQDGVVHPEQIHYHSIWRDRKRDYGNDLQNVPTAVRPAKRSLRFTAAAGPSRNRLDLDLHTNVVDATVAIYDSKGSKVVALAGVSGRSLAVDIGALPKGLYAIRVEDRTTRLASRFARL
jgi:hypothetical protein